MIDLFTLFVSQRGACFYCEERMIMTQHRARSITRDHRVPQSRNGPSTRANLVGACDRCNTLKGDLSEADFASRYPDTEAIERARAMSVHDAALLAAGIKKRAA